MIYNSLLKGSNCLYSLRCGAGCTERNPRKSSNPGQTILTKKCLLCGPFRSLSRFYVASPPWLFVLCNFLSTYFYDLYTYVIHVHTWHTHVPSCHLPHGDSRCARCIGFAVSQSSLWPLLDLVDCKYANLMCSPQNGLLLRNLFRCLRYSSVLFSMGSLLLQITDHTPSYMMYWVNSVHSLWMSMAECHKWWRWCTRC